MPTRTPGPTIHKIGVIFGFFEPRLQSPDMTPKFGPARLKSGHIFEILVNFGPDKTPLVVKRPLGDYQGSWSGLSPGYRLTQNVVTRAPHLRFQK